MKNLAFHSLLRLEIIKPPILITSLLHFYLNAWENVLLELGSEKVKPERGKAQFRRQNFPEVREKVGVVSEFINSVRPSWSFFSPGSARNFGTVLEQSN